MSVSSRHEASKGFSGVLRFEHSQFLLLLCRKSDEKLDVDVADQWKIKFWLMTEIMLSVFTATYILFVKNDMQHSVPSSKFFP